MKRVLLSFVILCVSVCLSAQTENNPFAGLGYKKQVTYTSSKGEFEEFHDRTDVVEIGSVLFDTKTNQVAGFVDEEKVQTDVASATVAMSVDPLCEKYYWISPYAYCLNNPVRYTDPNGRDVVISGTLSEEALRQLQAKVGNSITLSINDAGKVSYTMNTDKGLKGDAKTMVGMINDNSITVNLVTTDGMFNSENRIFVGGSFMGNSVTKDDNGNITVSAFQEINPNVLASADGFTKTPGKMIMHETTEAYEGAKISKETGVGMSPASNDNPGVYYETAHERATPQSKVVYTLYDANGRKLGMNQISSAVKIEWKVVSDRGASKVIQSYVHKK